MALRERIFSLEHEYGILFVPDDRQQARKPDEQLQRNTLIDVIHERYGIRGSEFIKNGARVYNDDHTAEHRGHPEISLPECRSPREVVAYEHAMEALLRTVLPTVQQRLIAGGYKGRLLIIKNNVDVTNKTFGCHENYLTLRNSPVLTSTYVPFNESMVRSLNEPLLNGRVYLQYLAHCLIPFLVTRQILCGAGQLVPAGANHPLGFHISQRAAHITTIFSVYSGRMREFERGHPPISLRGILDLSREADPDALTEGDAFRLHLILGDSNRSEWATWMKLGTTGLLLRLIEDLFIEDVPMLADPVAALHTISADPTCTATVALTDGTERSAIAIQRHYVFLAQRYLGMFGGTTDEQQIVAQWQLALDDLEADPLRLADRTDWALKRKLLQHYLEQRHLTFTSPLNKETILPILEMLNFRYHLLNDEGLFSTVPRSAARTCVSAEAIAQAIETPPAHTRAALRSTVMHLHTELPITINDWHLVQMGNEQCYVYDPLAFGNHHCFALCRAALEHPTPQNVLQQQAALTMIRQWSEALNDPNALIRIRAITYLGWWRDADNAQRIAQVAQKDAAPEVRSAAIRALAQLEFQTPTVTDAIFACLDDPDPTVSFSAMTALDRLRATSKQSA